MAWIEETKKGSRKSGGPQYYLQDLGGHNKQLLHTYGTRAVRLWTPYGVVESGLVAVSSRFGKVGHDRVQSRRKVPSVADQIAYWYGLARADIETIEFEDSFDNACFVIRPSAVKFFRRSARKTIYPDQHPLTLVGGHQSRLWTEQAGKSFGLPRALVDWVRQQIAGIVAQHEAASMNVDERDLLRAAGALDLLGIKLGMYRPRGPDCPDARIRLGSYPEYECPIEVEELSGGFLAAHHRLHRKMRILLLCAAHDRPEVLQGYVDIVELRELARLLKDVA